MKKLCAVLICLLLLCCITMPALAAPEGPQITLQPQSSHYPEYSVAIYTVKAEGTNLTATWYIEYEGKTYNASQIGGAMQPWEGYAGENYGAKKLDDNTFCFIFEGIEEELSGAKIWCDIEDGHYDVTSQVGYITVGDYASPPEIIDIPAQITVQRGDAAELRCIAKSTDGSQLNFLWYETDTGNLPDIRAIDRGAETGDFMLCDTRTAGTRYYVCGITTSNGGTAYSSAVAVNVEESTISAAAPKIQTETLPNVTVGTQYAVQLECTDPDAEFFPYYDPSTQNDLEEGSWLGLSIDGWLMGTPAKAGTYSFSVCAMGAGGTDYKVYTLTVSDPDSQEASKPTPDTQTTEPTTTEDNSVTTPTTETNEQAEQPEKAIPWWVLVLIGITAAGAGVGVAILLVKRKS